MLWAVLRSMRSMAQRSTDTWRAHWSKEGVNYYLSNFDGASEEAITAAAELLMGQN